jgi:hypothetical protein
VIRSQAVTLRLMNVYHIIRKIVMMLNLSRHTLLVLWRWLRDVTSPQTNVSQITLKTVKIAELTKVKQLVKLPWMLGRAEWLLGVM